MRRYAFTLLGLMALTWREFSAAIPNTSRRIPSLRPDSSSYPRPTIKNALLIRGGHLPFKLDPKDVVAKAACMFFMGQSTTAWLAPHRTCIKYGLTTSVLNVACNRKLATAYLSSAVMMYGMLFQHCTVDTAVGSGAVAWMFEQLRARLYYEAENIGRPVTGEYWIAFAATITAWATLWEPQHAPLAMKVSASLIIANGAAFFASPTLMCRIWSIPIGVTANPKNKEVYSRQVKEFNESFFLHRYMGVALVFSGILQAVLAWDGDIYYAIGCAYGFLFLVNCWSFLKTSDFKRLARSSISVSSTFDFKKRLAKLFFPLFNAVVSATLLLRGSKDHKFPAP
jgi:hypothetical protein